MITLTVTSKGQVTFKQALLQHLGIHPGEKIHVDTLPDGQAIIRAEQKKSKNINEAFGILKKKNKSNIVLSIEEIDELTRQSWTGEK